MARDPKTGQVYVAGYFGQKTSFGTYNLTSPGWHSNHNLSKANHVAGEFAGTAYVGASSWIKGAGSKVNAYLVKLDSAGKPKGSATAGDTLGKYDVHGYGVDLTAAGQPLLAGKFGGVAAFGTGGATLTKTGTVDLFIWAVGKLSP